MNKVLDIIFHFYSTVKNYKHQKIVQYILDRDFDDTKNR